MEAPALRSSWHPWPSSRARVPGKGVQRASLVRLSPAVAGPPTYCLPGSSSAAGWNQMLMGRPSAGLSIAMIGTRGVPAHYGGFETCVEEVGARLVDKGHNVVVYCRGVEPENRLSTYRGMTLVHLPAMKRRSAETLSHSALSSLHLFAHRTDVALVFNCANAPLLPVIRAAGIPVATHVDGLEWKRAKWGRAGQQYYRRAEKMAVRWSDALIADAAGIAEYYREAHNAQTEQIAYGAPQISADTTRIHELGLTPDGYHLVVARFEPENHVEEIVRGYSSSVSTLPLVVVGSAPYSDKYTMAVKRAADTRVRFLGGVWDQQLLDQLYAGARTYLHGHSVGGTNPSLLRAMGASTATTAFDVGFNREVLGDAGRYFATASELGSIIEEEERNSSDLPDRARRGFLRSSDYCWDDVANRYESLCVRMAIRSARPLMTDEVGEMTTELSSPSHGSVAPVKS